jgi:hypothetical protein
VHFYSNDWDGREDIKRIDTNRCKVALLTGEYDYFLHAEMSETVAASIPGSRLTIMKGMGHFPDDRELCGDSGRICCRRWSTWRGCDSSLPPLAGRVTRGAGVRGAL